MPELPEVETIKNELLPRIVGRRITGVEIFWYRIVGYPSPADFASRLIGKEIAGGRRRGKYLILELNGEFLIIHLKMSGSLLLDPASPELKRYTRAAIYLDNGATLYFRDPRKFGRLWLVDNPDSVTARLGPEPLEPGFTPELLAARLKNRTAPIKAILTDQAFIAGVGNMYADEALFAARIHPLRPGSSLTPEEIKRLHPAIQEVLKSAIADKGASIENYYRPDGNTGVAHFQFRVAHRGGQPCPVCGTSIERISVRNRGTYFCPRCQPLK